MDSRITPVEAALLMPRITAGRMPETERVRAIVAEARVAHATALLERFGRFLAGLGAALTASRWRRATEDELSSLSDRELADIGITRGNIPEVAWGAVPGVTLVPANDLAGTRRAA